MFEEEPRIKPPRALEDMSLEELASQIETLKEEIARCEAEIIKKKSVKNAADAIFGQ
ncbi:DUF1192 domain-containing protein [Hirschia baltica]|uniref:DUF1192 domain-containing protein n=1 Tax=Hirschia baltica (strain ATCC 49814 / DSM 5838 / IFAM 1418) TaxID=582402 RepID=C6XRM7_HIRBI|nr:DUF1192 domain-containing protein [Hirschia baltica]ACT60637.1 protein of unknown function DUF1192 [Hirschia baltica ATCC 49814]